MTHSIDPSVTAAELDRAPEGPSVAFENVAHPEKPDQQDFIGIVPDTIRQPLPPHRHGERPDASVCNTPRNALRNVGLMRRDHRPVGGVGLSWYHVRFNGWHVNPLWPTAEQAGLHGEPIHRYKRYDAAPPGMTLVFLNGELGLAGLSLGGGLIDVADYHEPGYNGVALVENVLHWCGADDWFGIETVNGVDVWPNRRGKPQSWTRHGLAAQLHQDAGRAGHRRASGLHAWRQEIGA